MKIWCQCSQGKSGIISIYIKRNFSSFTSKLIQWKSEPQTWKLKDKKLMKTARIHRKKTPCCLNRALSSISLFDKQKYTAPKSPLFYWLQWNNTDFYQVRQRQHSCLQQKWTKLLALNSHIQIQVPIFAAQIPPWTQVFLAASIPNSFI